MSKNQLQANKPSAVATTGSTLPAYMQGAKDLGVEDIGNEDVIVPRIKICQAMTTVKDEIDGLNNGMFYSSTKELMGEEIKIFVLSFYKAKTWFDNDKLLGYEAFDKKTKEYTRFGDKMEEILASKEKYDEGIDSYNYVAILQSELREAMASGGTPSMYIFTCASAAMKPAKQLNSKLKKMATRGVPIYGNLITVHSEAIKFDKGSAYMPVFPSTDEFANEDEFRELAIAHEIANDTALKAQKSEGDKGETVAKSEDGEDPFEL